MVSITINVEVLGRVGAQQNETFRGWNEIERKGTTLVTINTAQKGNFPLAISSNEGKHGAEKLRMQTLFTQWMSVS